ncbi:MAG: macrocin O-methyltransferase [Nitrospira sp.]|nr:macrocin O-methyltransferase [Nitrospira sp.]
MDLPRKDSVKLIHEIRVARLTYCGPPKLENISDAVERVVQECVEGDFVEAGVALGGSAVLLGLLKPRQATLHLYDVFGMIPPPGDHDGDDAHRRYEVIRSGASPGLGPDLYYGYARSLQEKVLSNLARWGLSCEQHHIKVHAGLFQDTLYPARPIAFAHIDCDWYDSVNTCITRILPLLAKGGIMVFDDYESYSGCKRAVDQLLDRRSDLQIIFRRRSMGIRLL